MRAELLFSCAYARTHARFFSPFVLGICSFSSVIIDVCLVSYKVCDCFFSVIKKKYIHTDLQTTIIIGLLGAYDTSV